MFAIRPITLFALATVLAIPAACASDVSSNTATPASDAVPSGGAKGNAENGKELFLSNACVACHGVTKEDTSKVGPSLFGVVGRKAGTSPSLLGASENLKKYGVTWSVETLNEFLVDPSAKVPGTPMSGVLADPQQRADVIAYLSTLK